MSSGLKRKQPSSGVAADIRSFFSSPPSPASKPRVPLATEDVSRKITSTTTTSAPPTATSSTKNPGVSTTGTEASPPRSPDPVGCSSKPAVLTAHPPRKRRTVPANDTPEVVRVSVPATVEVIATVGGSSSAPRIGAKRLHNKENGMGKTPPTRHPPPAAAVQQQQRAPNGKKMSRFFLVPSRRSAGASTESDYPGSVAYQLPTSDTVVGRDSVRDAHRANANKLRIGVPNNEEGISRDQATLRVDSSGGRVLVTNKTNALNPIRIVRRDGPARVDAEQATNNAGRPPGPSIIILGGGMGEHLYPGDSLELDGFRRRGRSRFSYVLRLLPIGAERVGESVPGREGQADAKVAEVPATRNPADALSSPVHPGAVSLTPASCLGTMGSASNGDSGIGRHLEEVEGRGTSSTSEGPASRTGHAASTPASHRAQQAALPVAGDAVAGVGGMVVPGVPTPAGATTASLERDWATIRKKRARTDSNVGCGDASPSGGSPVPALATPVPSSSGEEASVPPGGGGGGGSSSSARETPTPTPGAEKVGGSPGKREHFVMPGPGASVAASVASGRCLGADGCHPSEGRSEVSAAAKASGSEVIPKDGTNAAGKPDDQVAPRTSGGGAISRVAGDVGGVASPSPVGPPSMTTTRKGDMIGTDGMAIVGAPPAPVDDEVGVGVGVGDDKGKEGLESSASASVTAAAAAAAVAAPKTSSSAASAKGSEPAEIEVETRPEASAACFLREREAGSAEGAAEACAGGPSQTGHVLEDGRGGDESGDVLPGAVAESTKGEESSARVKTEAEDGTGPASAGAVDAGSGRSWEVGDMVVLRARVGRGQNKPGGVGRIVSALGDGTYKVKLVVGCSRPQRVSADLLYPCDHHFDLVSSAPRRRDPSAPRSKLDGAARPDPCNGLVVMSRPLSPPPLGSADVGGRSESNWGAGNAGDPPGTPGPEDEQDEEEEGEEVEVGGSTEATAPSGMTARPGDRARVLYDDRWYLGTVLAVRRLGLVTVRFDDGSEERVTLCPGDAEVCPDDEPEPDPDGATSVPSVSALLGDARAGSRGRRPGGGTASVTPPGPEGSALTERRARALLDTTPEKLIGLAYREYHRAYGGWCDTIITGVSEEKVEDGEHDGAEGIERRWPEAVTVEQLDPDGASPGRLLVKRRVGLLLTRLRAWDKHRQVLIEEEAKTRARRHARSPSPATRSPASPGKASSAGARAAEATQLRKAFQQASPPTPCPSPWTPSPSTRQTRRAISGRPQQRGSRARLDEDVGVPPPREAPAGSAVIIGGPGAGDGARASPGTGLGAGGASVGGRADARRGSGSLAIEGEQPEAGGEDGELPTCAFCGQVFYSGELRGGVDSHLLSCSRRASSAAAAKGFPADVHEAGSAGSGAPAAQMPSGMSSMLTIGVEGDDLASVLSVWEELSARGFRPSQVLCDRTMQALLKSRCRFRTECLRRMLEEALAKHPGCWEPLNWGRFEESLQRIAAEKNPVVLRAQTAAVSLTLDCVLRCYRRPRTPAVGTGPSSSSLPPLYAGAGGNRDGREALKKSARWAAKTWARRCGGVPTKEAVPLAGREADARACLTMARALAEATEAFCAAASAPGDGHPGSPRLEAEACQVVVVEVEAHCGELSEATTSKARKEEGEAAARSRAGLMSALAWRSFCPRLAGMLLENMPRTVKGCPEVDRLRDLLGELWARSPAGASSGGRGGGAKRNAPRTGSSMLEADLER